MARPLKRSEYLDKRVTLRIPESVFVDWKAQAVENDECLSDWIRSRVETDQSPPVISRIRTPSPAPKMRPAPKADPKLILEVARIGNNINQLSHHCNTLSKIDQGALTTLIEIERQLKRLAGAH